MAEEKKKKLNVLQLLAVSFASVASMCIGSIFGIRGTYIGTGVGTMMSGVIAYIFEKMSLKAHDNIRKQKWFFHDDDEDVTSLIPAIRVKRSQRKPVLAFIGVGMGLLSAGIAFSIFGVVKASGTTLGDYAPASPQPAVTVTQTPSDTITPSGTESPPESPSASSSPSPSPSPSPSLSPSVSYTGVSQ